MSGYPDDRDDNRDRRDENDRNDDARDIRRAKSLVMTPAIGLIVVAVFGLLSAVYNGVQLASFDKQFDAAVKQIEDDQQMPAAQKKDQLQMMDKIRDPLKTAMLPLVAMQVLFSIITLGGGLKLMSLSGSGLVYFGALLACVPCVSGCCFLGLLFGIWAMMAMSKPEVKAGFAAKRRASYSPDAY